MSAGTEERVEVVDPLLGSEIVHICCCRRFGVKAVCGVSLVGDHMVRTEPDCVVCVDIVDTEYKAMAVEGRDHAHCAIDGRPCIPEER